MLDPRQFQSRMQQLDDLLHEAEQNADPVAQAVLQKLASGMLELHGIAIERILENVTAAGDAGAAILDTLGRDEIVSSLLILHGLHPLSIDARIRGALEKVKPYLASHGGHVELQSVTEEGVVSLRLEGSCHGCPSSRVTLQSNIEQEIYAAAPEVTAIVVEGLVEEAPPKTSGFIPIDSIAINGVAVHAAAASS
jgi:Fe-S cluster biogenesis protein NfuA